jgi:uncharacterized RDD family membrane protein YckC
MSSSAIAGESERGYLSAESKRRFTIIAGVLGAVFFLGQILLPMAIMFLVMMPAMFMRDMKSLDLEGTALVGDDLWAVERAIKLNMRKSGEPSTTLALTRVRLADLSEAGPAIPLEGLGSESTPDLTVTGGRLWIFGPGATAYYEKGLLKLLPGTTRPARASRPFVYQGRPAVITLGAAPTLAMLQGDTDAKWVTRELSLGHPGGVGSLTSVQAVEADGSLYLFGLLCSDAPDHCSLSYRDLDRAQWLPLVDEVCSCANWTALALASRPAVFLSERPKGGRAQLSIVTVTANGPQRRPVETIEGHQAWRQWRPLASGSRLVLVSEGLPGGLRVAEVEDGRVVRTSKKPGSFPFGPNMMVLMMIPQLLPIVLSLLLAFLLTIQMRRHRVPDYTFGAERRAFASLWQRALAQLVDLVPFVAGFVIPMVWMWRIFSDPESLFENGPTLPFIGMFALFMGAFIWMLIVFLAYSYLEGRFGKTPGKWLVGIRVLGTDLQPCGFGRAFLRNLLTLVDGFFNFLVGALLVALTENWQRLGDMAARTIVVVDQKPAPARLGGNQV